MPLINFIITILNLPRLVFHILAFFLFYSQCKQDVEVAIKHREYNISVFWGFCYLLVFDKMFRNLFYKRIGKAKYLMWYWLWPHPSFTLASNMEIGHSFLCIHPFATIVNADKIGNNFSIRNNSTIGNNKRGERPIIGNNVTINANSVVIGKISIGDNVIIGAGTVLTKSVPPNCTVVGNPAYILRENGILVKKKL